jgi:hypothetical protein
MVEDASFIKLREVSASYNVGRSAGFGDWTVSVIGRNLKTWTDYKGFDPGGRRRAAPRRFRQRPDQRDRRVHVPAAAHAVVRAQHHLLSQPE